MADLLQDFESYFNSKGITTVVYKDTAPSAPDDLVAVYEYEGSPIAAQFDGAIRSIQFVVRDTSANAARLKANELYKALLTEDGILYLTPDRWSLVHLKQTPFRMKSDESGRTYYAFNATVITYID